MSPRISSAASYEEKFALLDRNMRWEVAHLLRDRYLTAVNAISVADATVPDTFYVRRGKRILDVAIAAAALVVTLPLNAAVYVATAATLGRPIFFKQKRLGLNGELFTLVKFRNMRECFDKNGHPLPGHLRVTRLGKIMRKTSLDELLNFWSVLKGDMSIIGPRPLVPEYRDRYSARHAQRMKVRPGIECPPRSFDSAITGYGEQFENDIWYIQNMSFSTDMRLIWQLVRLTTDRELAKRRARASKGSFMGYNDHGELLNSSDVPEWALDAVLGNQGLLGDVTEEKEVVQA